jgi:hypothetical protein
MHGKQMLLMFYELYKIPKRYRQIMKEIIIHNRLIKKTFNQMLINSKHQKENREKMLKEWEIVKS